MQKDAYAAIVSTAFAVALTVTPGLQRWWLAAPTWGLTVWAGWRWYSHREQSDEPASKFDGKFFTAPPAKPPRGQKLDWLDVRIVAIAVSFGRTGETCVAMQLAITNQSTDSAAKLKLFLADSHVTEETRRMQVLAAAPKYEVMRRQMPDTPASGQLLYPPVTAAPGEKGGDVWFFHPARRQSLPMTSLIVEDVVSGAIWSVEIDPKYSKAVADNPTVPVLWFGRDEPIVVMKGEQMYRLP